MSGYFVEVFLCFSLTYIVIGYFVKVFLVLHGLRILWLIICRSFSGSAICGSLWLIYESFF